MPTYATSITAKLGKTPTMTGPLAFCLCGIPPKPGNGKPKNQHGVEGIRTWRKEVMTKIIEVFSDD
jgi:hypothetical protein